MMSKGGLVKYFVEFLAVKTWCLGMIRSDVSLPDAPGLGTAEDLAGISENNRLAAFSCSPYSKQVVEACKAAFGNAITTIVVTNRASSLLNEFAKHAILVLHQTSFLSNSLTAYTFCVESLINGVATNLGDDSETALKRIDKLIAALGIEPLYT